MDQEMTQQTARSFLLRLGPAVVFALLMVVSIYSAVRIEIGIENVRKTEQLSQEFRSLHNLIPPEDADLQHLTGAPSVPGVILDQFEARFPEALRKVASVPGEQRTAREIVASNSRLQSLEREYNSLLESGRIRQAERLHERELSPAFVDTHRLIDGAVASQAAKADDKLADLEGDQERNLFALPVAFVLGGVLLVFLSVTDRRRRQREAETQAQMRVLERAALSDSLTGLRNHRAFHEDLLGRVQEARASGAELCVLMLDLEGLKRLNDTHGHQVGDERLRALARALREAVREEDSIYRVGGDEFAVLLPGQAAWTGFEIANRIRDALHREADRAEVAIGVAELEDSGDKDTVIHRADLALVNAKRSSRKVVTYSFDLEPPATDQEDEVERHRRYVLASALAHAVDAKDTYTRSHSETVSMLCVQMGRRLGLAPARIGQLRVAGLLHDVGKIGTPDQILNKPGELTDQEYEVMKEHPVLGASIALSAELDEEAEWILHHHERPDGGGYPHGLAGDQVPLESRIILVADAFEALISDRPYRKGRPEQEALAEIERNVPAQFDACCVEALREMVGAGEAVELATLRA
jgi:diguanylate cyclase (GGDEF)-like protein/putative nucleotidyltransferase with HDIG domain